MAYFFLQCQLLLACFDTVYSCSFFVAIVANGPSLLTMPTYCSSINVLFNMRKYTYRVCSLPSSAIDLFCTLVSCTVDFVYQYWRAVIVSVLTKVLFTSVCY